MAPTCGDAVSSSFAAASAQMSNSSWSYLPSVAYDQTTCVIARTLNPDRTLDAQQGVASQQTIWCLPATRHQAWPVLCQP